MNPETASPSTVVCERYQRKESKLMSSMRLLLRTIANIAWLLLAWPTTTTAMPTASPWVITPIVLLLATVIPALPTVCVPRLEALSIFSCDTRMTPNDGTERRGRPSGPYCQLAQPASDCSCDFIRLLLHGALSDCSISASIANMAVSRASSAGSNDLANRSAFIENLSGNARRPLVLMG